MAAIFDTMMVGGEAPVLRGLDEDTWWELLGERLDDAARRPQGEVIELRAEMAWMTGAEGECLGDHSRGYRARVRMADIAERSTWEPLADWADAIIAHNEEVGDPRGDMTAEDWAIALGAEVGFTRPRVRAL